MEYRTITKDEKRLLIYLINKANINLPHNWEKQLKVLEMDDGNMGSLYLSISVNNEGKKQGFGKTISECQFKDSDGIDVIASLNVDTAGNLYEIDIWKVNYTPLKRIPLDFD